MSYLYQYLLFLAEVVTLTVALLAVISAIASFSMRARKEGPGHLELRQVNDDYDVVRDMVEEQLLGAGALKKRRKERDRQRKREQKAADARSEKELADKELAHSEVTDSEVTDRELVDNVVGRPRIFILRFDGDVEASAAEGLKQQINGILRAARDGDEVLVRVFSPGGVVHGYGYAASQLARLKSAKRRLVVAVDLVAASGGYLMACVADELIASPFALVGSIGVVVELPNVHRLLKRHDVDVELITAGEHKRTLTILGHNTDQGREKLKQEIDDVHALFKEYVAEHRPALELATVATGEAWYGKRALELKLVDRLQTSDEYLQERVDTADLLELNWVPHRKGVEGLLERFSAARRASQALRGWLHRLRASDLLQLNRPGS